MATAVVYEGDVQRSEPTPGQLFAGQKLWFSRSVPSRTWLMQNAEHNGAQVVLLEQQADIKLVDHARKNQAPGTHSYRYVELSIRNGRLEDLDAHRVGSTSRVDRPVGSVVTAGKGSRNRFTEAEEQLLWDWIQPYREAGGAWKGLEIYKQLEAVNSNHTYQSWRDRWINHTQYQKRKVTPHVEPLQPDPCEEVDRNPRSPKRRRFDNQISVAPQRANISVVQKKQDRLSEKVVHQHNMGNAGSSQQVARNNDTEQLQRVGRYGDGMESAEPHPVPTGVVNAEAEDKTIGSKAVDRTGVREAQNTNSIEDDDDDDEESSVSADSSRLPLAFNFTQTHARMLYRATCAILDARPDKLDQSWAGVAEEYGHAQDSWRKFFYDLIVPEYMKRHGITSNEELEVHYKAKVREQRQRQKAEAKAEANAAEYSHERGDEDGNKNINQLATDVIRKQQRKPDETGLAQTDRFDEHLPADHVEDEWNRDHSVYHEKHVENMPLSHMHRPPKPNESRKLSQGKSSQSTSSQTRSGPPSQPLQTLQQTRVAPETAIALHDGDDEKPELNQFHQSHSLEVYSSVPLQAIDRDSTSQERPSRTDLDPQEASQSLTSRLSERAEDHLSRFVTQISHGGQTISTESDADLQDIPYQNPNPSNPRPRSESPLFVPEDEERLRTPSPPRSNGDFMDELRSSPLEVKLVEGEDLNFGNGRSSESASSEAPSEGIQFESQIQLSQAWETAPEKEPQTDVPAEAENAIDENVTVETSLKIQRPKIQKQDDLQPSQDPDNNFETAPAELLIDHTSQSQGSIETLPVNQAIPSKRLDTQALFELPIPTNLAELATIPEPPDGWDDEDNTTSVNINRKTVEEDVTASEADWTLPLPDLDIESTIADQTISNQDDGTDFDNWLADQPKLYPSLPPFFIGPLSYRALETASMDLFLASTILVRMVQRFEKGKLPAHHSLKEIRKLPKRERRGTISKIVEELVPADMSGCWTADDDKALLGENGRAVKSVQDKHGEEGIRTRFEFLELWFAR